jgi:hypothetical protein
MADLDLLPSGAVSTVVSCSNSFANDVRSSALTDADFRGCRWIEGEPMPLRSGMFCGSPVRSGESWCDAHRSLVFCGARIAGVSDDQKLRVSDEIALLATGTGLSR